MRVDVAFVSLALGFPPECSVHWWVLLLLVVLHFLHQGVALPELRLLVLEQCLDRILCRRHVVNFAPAIVVQVPKVRILFGHLGSHVAGELLNLATLAEKHLYILVASHLQVLQVVNFLQRCCRRFCLRCGTR